MGPFILVVVVVGIMAYAYFILNKAYKDRSARDTVAFLLGPHDNLSREVSSMTQAKKIMLEEFVKRHGKSFTEYTGVDILNIEEFLSFIAARFDEYVIKNVLKVHGTNREIRIYDLKKGGKSLTIALAMVPVESVIFEYFFYTPINGLEFKKKEILEIVNMCKIPEASTTNAMYEVRGTELVPHTYNWRIYLRDAELDPIQTRIGINGKFTEKTKEEIIEMLRIKLFIEKGQHCGLFGSPGTGKTSFWRAWVQALTPILAEGYRIVALTPSQFEEWLEGYETWNWFSEEMEHQAIRTVIIVDDMPALSNTLWSNLLSMMSGMLQDRMNISFMISWKASSKEDLIANIQDEYTSRSLLRRLTYIVEFRTYSSEQMRQKAKTIEGLLQTPYVFNRAAAEEVLRANTALSPAGGIALSEIYTAVERDRPGGAKQHEPKIEPKQQEQQPLPQRTETEDKIIEL